MGKKFRIVSDFKLAGDQPEAVEELVRGVAEGKKSQVLLGVTGSGKTFTAAKLIERAQKPALVISPNKILAAQLYAEFKSLFPENAVEYFISYYDYYQPEAYIPSSDTYIEKDSSINDHIDRLRLKATTSLLERRDVIVVASVSCIYNLGSPAEYLSQCVRLEKGAAMPVNQLFAGLVGIRYERNDIEFARGKFRARGDTIDIFPAYLETALRVEMNGDEIERIREFAPLSGKMLSDKERAYVYPAKHFVITRPELESAVKNIEAELEERLAELTKQDKLLEAQRLKQRTHYDIEMLLETGFCHGIENYSRVLSGRAVGSRPACLIDYFNSSPAKNGDFLTIIDESHITVPQIRGMYEGDRSRKQTLVDFGFRLPSALDNRPLKFDEFEKLAGQTLFVSATPGPYELKQVGGEVVDLVIRPTGLIDPEVEIRPIDNQINDLVKEITACISKKERVLVTTLTKRTSEDLTEYLREKDLKVQYLHSDIESLERIEILKNLRQGKFDVLVGINLLREGLDLPEVALVAILDADKEGFLRSETTIIQTCGRAARNINGRVILYADRITGSMERALSEMSRRRKKQAQYNKEHNITPRTIVKAIHDLDEFQYKAKEEGLSYLMSEDGSQYVSPGNMDNVIGDLEKQMRQAADNLDFETAALLRDRIIVLKEMRAGKTGNSGMNKLRKNGKD